MVKKRRQAGGALIMASSKCGIKTTAHQDNAVTVKIITQNPDKIIGVTTTRVYSQIARMGRDPHKQTERAFLISTLDKSKVESTINGKIIKKDPPFVTMKAKDVQRCFGHQIERLPKSSFFNMSKNQNKLEA